VRGTLRKATQIKARAIDLQAEGAKVQNLQKVFARGGESFRVPGVSAAPDGDGPGDCNTDEAQRGGVYRVRCVFVSGSAATVQVE
jgi:hypothetical protein